MAFEVFQAFVIVFAAELPVRCSGNTIFTHKFLGKSLASFQHGAFAAGANYGNGFQVIPGTEKIGNPFYQRLFRPHHYHSYAFFKAEFSNLLKIKGRQVNISATPGSSGITGSDIQFFAKWALGKFPCQGMFSSTRPK